MSDDEKSRKRKYLIQSIITVVVIGGVIVWLVRDLIPEDEPPEKRYTREICSNLVVPCHAKTDTWGNISGEVIVDISSTGKVEASTYRGDGPAVVQGCLTRSTKARSISDYNGDPLRITCQYSGNLTRGSQMMSTSWNLEKRNDKQDKRGDKQGDKPGDKRGDKKSSPAKK